MLVSNFESIESLFNLIAKNEHTDLDSLSKVFGITKSRLDLIVKSPEVIKNHEKKMFISIYLEYFFG